MKVLVVGCGNMGYTYLESFQRSHILEEDDFYILEKTSERKAELNALGYNNVFIEAGDFVSKGDVVILSVKPQDFLTIANTIRPFIEKDQVIISIMAGVTISSIQEALGIHKVIRSMPNLPSQVGFGMTTFTAADAVTRGELMFAQNLLGSTGQAMYLKKESLIDASTAISGSGPAYVFYFMNALIHAGVEMGFTQAESEQLVKQTFRGSLQLQSKSKDSCEDWIKKVSSKGGTTEAAINSFNASDVLQKIQVGAKQALNRAIELGKK